MRCVSFDMLGRSGWFRGRTGYLMHHPNHPGREFIIARGLVRKGDGMVRESGEWVVLDRSSGIAALDRKDRKSTLSAAVAHAATVLEAITPAALQERIATRTEKVLTSLLKGVI